ncbi:hypothetical protein C0Q70_09596 [Pomacea canaliculata]|uniref:Uncharacterized protein n=1 Tax=Pomacea canaliculata TaxID=400727 RepID=A0A2T7PA93_POMCA|nr:hypothetical protein C0Q70_09596 [Pomacea canaliculata]
MCKSGECILAEWTCDTQADCQDGSDEQECECVCRGEHKFQCQNGKCVPSSFICDSDNDCGDMSDETDCPPPHPSVCSDHLSVRGCLQMNDTSTPICLDDDLGFKYCRKFCNLCLSDE